MESHLFFVESLDFLYKGLEYYSKPSIYDWNYVHNMAHFWHILPFFLQSSAPICKDYANKNRRTNNSDDESGS